MFNLRRVFIILALTSLTVSTVGPAMARGGGGGRSFHPRRSEVMHRSGNINRRLSRDQGHLGGHYGQLSREDRGIRRETRHDMRQNGGYLTKGEQQHINGQENQMNHQIASDYRGRGNWNRGPGSSGPGYSGGQGYRGQQGNWNRGQWNRSQFDSNHPRRAEVLGRDNRLNGDLNRDKGKLGGNYQSLKGQDQSIRQQERADAKANGGYITPQQKQQLNQEENTLHKDIRQDLKPAQ